jgi:hypothetical protein
MLFEIDIEPVCMLVISLGGCMTIAYLTVYAGGGNPSVTLAAIVIIALILMVSLHIACRRIVVHPRPTYVVDNNIAKKLK